MATAARSTGGHIFLEYGFGFPVYPENTPSLRNIPYHSRDPSYNLRYIPQSRDIGVPG